MKNRIKVLRKYLGLNQRDFSKKIDVGSSTLAMFETGQRTPKDIHIKRICSEFNVNEEWLRNGIDPMINELSTFSLDEYAEKKGMTSLEKSIVEAYLDLDSTTREKVMTALKNVFFDFLNEEKKEFSATIENYETTAEIEEKVEEYRRQLLADKEEEEFIEQARKVFREEKRRESQASSAQELEEDTNHGITSA